MVCTVTDSLLQDSLLDSDDRQAAEKEAYARAIKLLARREHSRQELRLKLTKAGFDEIAIDNTLQKLFDKGFQSDQRFAELFVEQRFNKGYGERDILARLGQRGIERELAGSALAEFVSKANIDWYAHAASVLAVRFDLSAMSAINGNANDDRDYNDDSAESRRADAYRQSKERQRIRKQWGNYLLRRGFSNDQVMFALENPENENNTDTGT